MKRRVRTVFCCAVLELAMLVGIPVRPDDVQRLLRSLDAPRVAHEEPDREASGDGEDPASPA